MDIRNRYNLICWSLLEAKLAYYQPDAIHPSWKPHVTVSDHTYDSLENEAKSLALELNETFIPYVGIPNTASMKIVRFKLSHKKTTEMESCLSRVV